MKNLKEYMIESCECEEVDERKVEEVLSNIKESKEELIDEGILTGILGGVVGMTGGVSVMKAICKALGIKEGSLLYNTLTSRAVCTTVGYAIGK